MAKVSVLIGIYNCERTLGEALDSILAQTYEDWECILCDDGSTDGTLLVAKSYARRDRRFKVIQNGCNKGLAASLNHCLSYAGSEYIARMDGDDRSKPERLNTLVNALDTRADIAMVSTAMECFDELGPWGVVLPRKEFPVPADFPAGNPFCHAPSMVRRKAMTTVNGYRTGIGLVEDFDLWVRLYAHGYCGMNLMMPLYEVRENRDTNARRSYGRRIDEAKVIVTACKIFRLPVWSYLWTLRPLCIGLFPIWFYNQLRRRRHAPAGKLTSVTSPRATPQ